MKVEASAARHGTVEVGILWRGSGGAARVLGRYRRTGRGDRVLTALGGEVFNEPG